MSLISLNAKLFNHEVLHGIENKNDKFFYFHFDSNFSLPGAVDVCEIVCEIEKSFSKTKVKTIFLLLSHFSLSTHQTEQSNSHIS